MRVAILCSAGGSAFLEVADACPHVEFFLITDRACGAEEGCKARNIPCVRVEAGTNVEFSARAAATLRAHGEFDFVLMFFSRLVMEPLLSEFRLLNIHPALLPAFKGLSAVKQAMKARVRFLGATLHVANAEMDAGPIIAQSCQPIGRCDDLAHLEKLAFLHKVGLFFLAIDLAESGHLHFEGGKVRVNPNLPASDRLNPALTNPRYLEAMRALQNREGVHFL